MATLSQAGPSDRQEDKDVPQPDENASTEASFTWYDAVALSFAIVAFFFHTLCGAKLLLVYWSTVQAGRFIAVLVVLLSSAVLFRGEPRGPRRPVLSHPVPIEFTKLKARSGFILLVPPVWLIQELYYGLKSKWALEEDDEAFYLGLVRDIRPTNHVLRMYQGCEALIYLAMSLCHLGPRSLEPSSLSAFEVLSLLVPSVSYALAQESTRLEIKRCVPHKSGSCDCDEINARPSWSKFLHFSGDWTRLVSRASILTLYFNSFGLAGCVLLWIVWFLSGTIGWWKRAGSFTVESIERRVKRKRTWPNVCMFWMRALQKVASFFYVRAHCSLHADRWDVAIDVVLDVIAVSVFFPAHNQEGRVNNDTVLFVLLTFNVLGFALVKLAACLSARNSDQVKLDLMFQSLNPE